MLSGSRLIQRLELGHVQSAPQTENPQLGIDAGEKCVRDWGAEAPAGDVILSEQRLALSMKSDTLLVTAFQNGWICSTSQ